SSTPADGSDPSPDCIHAGWRGPANLWRVVAGAGLWRGLVSARLADLGPLSGRSVGVCRALGLDLGGRRSMGFRTLPLRPLGSYRVALGLGPWRGKRPR